MNTENLRQLVNELTDLIYIERKVVFTFISIAFFIKLGFYWMHSNCLSRIDDLRIVKSADIAKESKSYYSKGGSTMRLFPFYPASASQEELMELGFSARVANILINYRTKGGQFRSKQDVKKIYGVTPELYTRIEPYILLNSAANTFEKQNLSAENKMHTAIDVNFATKEEWKSLPGIGEYFATKLTEKREGLGAFIDLEQIAEVYNLPDSTFQKIKPLLRLTKGSIKKLNINTAKEEELRKHPYILRWQADDIMRHRPIYGLDDLYDLKTYKDKTKNKYVGIYFEF
ncbi:MAG: helix-hairpin-helix domain-containing protein [Chitinophagales bacterium]